MHRVATVLGSREQEHYVNKISILPKKAQVIVHFPSLLSIIDWQIS